MRRISGAAGEGVKRAVIGAAQLSARHPDTIEMWVAARHCWHLVAAQPPSMLRRATQVLAVV